MNRWEFLLNICEFYFGFILFVVNDKLCVVGGYKFVGKYGLGGEIVSVEVYNVGVKYWLIVY